MRTETKRKIIAITAIVIVVMLIVGLIAPVIMGSAASAVSYNPQYSQLQRNCQNTRT